MDFHLFVPGKLGLKACHENLNKFILKVITFVKDGNEG